MAFYQPDETNLKELRELTSPDRILTGSRIPEDYTHDEMIEYGCFSPIAVVETLTTEEVSRVMQYAHAHNIAVTPRGAGTGLCGASVPIFGGLVLSTAKMNRILEIDPNTMTITTEPGVLLMDLAKACLDRELFYPPDPGEKSATVGGNVMTNAGGMRAVKYGVTRDYVRGMEVVLADGTVLSFGGKVSKNSSGYSLKDLMIGSEGTLGIVTKVYFKVLPAPRKMTSLLIPFEAMDNCLAAVPHILQSPEVPATIEFMEQQVILDAQEYLGKIFPHTSAAAYLIVSFYGDSKQEAARHYEYVVQTCLSAGAIDAFISNTEERQESIWSARGAFLEAIKSSTGGMDECDVVLPLHHVCAFIAYTRVLSEQMGLRIRSFGHAGDGNLHVYACQDDLPAPTWSIQCKKTMDSLYHKANEMGGQVSGEHGIGHAKKQYLLESLGETQIMLMQKIKSVFDPKGILNPGKVI